MRYPLASFFLRADVAHRSKAAHIARSSPHQVVGIHHAKRFDVDEILYQHCVKKLLVGYLRRWWRVCAPNRARPLPTQPAAPAVFFSPPMTFFLTNGVSMLQTV